MVDPEKAEISTLRTLTRTIKKSWALFKRSKLGLAGTAVIAIFVFLAVFAQWISPFTPEFLAPDSDVFKEVSYTKTYNASARLYDPVIGPSAPKDPLKQGGRLWIIMTREDGRVFMDPVMRNATPFSDPGAMLEFNITDFGLRTPVTNMLYIVPGRNRLGQTEFYDDLRKNGLLAFVANQELILFDPFQSRILYRDDVGFQPKWFVEDPVSSGDMYEFPLLLYDVFSGFHTWRFIVAANDTHVTVYRVNYRSSQDSPQLSGVDKIVSVDLPVTAMPLAYYLQLNDQRSGILVPTANNKLAVFSIDGTVRVDLNLTLGGEPSNVTAPIGYIRAPEIFMLYVPLKSANNAGIGYLLPRDTRLGNLTFEHELVIDDPNATVTVQPDPGNADTPQFVLTHYSACNPVSSDLLRGSPNGMLDPVVDVPLSRPVIGFFFSPTTSQVMALDTDGTVWSHPTVSLSVLRQGLTNFLRNSDPNRKTLMYMGSWGGAKYSIQMSSEETLALVFEPGTGRTTILKIIGTSIAPLPPGKYPSGNTYWLGTDDQGHDILTQLIYGSRVALEVGIVAALAAVVIGTIVGLVAGFYGGLLDTILMRLTDIALVLPFLPIVLILAAILGPSILNIIIVIAVLGWPGIARVIRAQTLSLKERPFVDAARISGASRSRTMIIHIGPNVLPFAFLYMTLNVGGAILTEAAVSFLGLGDPRPGAVSWGIMLRTLSSSGNTLTAWWWLLPPGLCITLVSLGFYLVGRAIDDIVNPRLRER